jgi:hypothetical protein
VAAAFSLLSSVLVLRYLGCDARHRVSTSVAVSVARLWPTHAPSAGTQGRG